MNAMRLLLEHPGEMARLRAEPTRIRLMIDEALRLESPVQWLQRYVLKDTVLAGVEIPRGSVVLTVWAAGNRDPERFEDPAAFRIDRQNVVRDHLAFGYGSTNALALAWPGWRGRLPSSASSHGRPTSASRFRPRS